jgi:flagellar biosynthesis chaperone FliJ
MPTIDEESSEKENARAIGRVVEDHLKQRMLEVMEELEAIRKIIQHYELPKYKEAWDDFVSSLGTTMDEIEDDLTREQFKDFNQFVSDLATEMAHERVNNPVFEAAVERKEELLEKQKQLFEMGAPWPEDFNANDVSVGLT